MNSRAAVREEGSTDILNQEVLLFTLGHSLTWPWRTVACHQYLRCVPADRQTRTWGRHSQTRWATRKAIEYRPTEVKGWGCSRSNTSTQSHTRRSLTSETTNNFSFQTIIFYSSSDTVRKSRSGGDFSQTLTGALEGKKKRKKIGTVRFPSVPVREVWRRYRLRFTASTSEDGCTNFRKNQRETSTASILKIRPRASEDLAVVGI